MAARSSPPPPAPVERGGLTVARLSAARRLGGEGDLLLEARPARPTPRAAHSAPPPPPRVLQSWNSELYPGRTAPEHVGEARRPRMEHVAMWGEGGGLPDKHPSVGMTVGKVFMCLFVFVKRKTRKD